MMADSGTTETSRCATWNSACRGLSGRGSEIPEGPGLTHLRHWLIRVGGRSGAISYLQPGRKVLGFSDCTRRGPHGGHMQRREFIIFLGGAAAAWPLIARAQQPTKVVRIGVLAYSAFPPLQRFAHKLREHGYIEGQNLRFESRFAEGRDDRYPALAAELIAVPVDIIVTWGTVAAIAAKQATSTIPIVMGAIGDPVDVGVVSNLARPGGNITGFANLAAPLEAKRLELLKELLPQLACFGWTKRALMRS